METALLELLRCPFCHAPVAAVEGDLACTACERRFGVEDGIPLMLHEDLPGAREKLGETAGWVEKARVEGWYEPDDTVDAVLPFVNRELGWNDLVWLANGHSFQVLLDRYVGELRGLRVLEVGAAKAWAARFWLERECGSRALCGELRQRRKPEHVVEQAGNVEDGAASEYPPELA